MKESTIDRLILAAEKLVATKGLSQLKASDVVQMAGVKNGSAINYHFGSMQNLLDSVAMYRSQEFGLYRNTVLSEIRLIKTNMEIADWFFVLFSPMAFVIELNAPSSYHCSFLAQMQMSDQNTPLDYLKDDIHKSAATAMAGAYKEMIKVCGYDAANQMSVMGSDSSVIVFAMEEKRTNKLVLNQEKGDSVNIRQRMGRRLVGYIDFTIAGFYKEKYTPIDQDYYIALYEILVSQIIENQR